VGQAQKYAFIGWPWHFGGLVLRPWLLIVSKPLAGSSHGAFWSINWAKRVCSGRQKAARQ
jgi:hypothetical protein